jgi:hypothetical protein
MAGLRSYVRRHHVALLALFVALGGTSFAAVKTIVGRDGVIHGCFKNRGGTLRVLPASRRCAHGESTIAWNRDGRPGVPGIQGPTGPQGEVGQAAVQPVSGRATIGSTTLTTAAPTVATDLTATGASGKIVTTFPGRLVIHATADLSKPTAQASLQEAVACRLALNSGSGLQDAGTPADVTLPSITTTEIVFGHSSPAATADVAAGTYNVRLTCTRNATSSDAGSTATLSSADLDVIAVPR